MLTVYTVSHLTEDLKCAKERLEIMLTVTYSFSEAEMEPKRSTRLLM